MRITCSIAIAGLATYGTWAVVSGFLNCIPIAKFWDPSIEGFCLSPRALWFSNASMHIFTDLVILVIPIPALINLKLPLKQKIGVIVVFALGSLYATHPLLGNVLLTLNSVCVTSVIRLISLNKISYSHDASCSF